MFMSSVLPMQTKSTNISSNIHSLKPIGAVLTFTTGTRNGPLRTQDSKSYGWYFHPIVPQSGMQ